MFVKSPDARRLLGRRDFVRTMAAGGALAAAAAWRGWPALAAILPQHDAPVLSGTEFDLTVDRLPVNFTGRRSVATAVNGSVPGPTLRWREGDTVTLRVTNRLSEPTSIHWHAIRLPSNMDGVPGLSFAGIAPGTTFTYRFPVRQSGTYWYHSHSRFQEQLGLLGALVIAPKSPDPAQFDREYVVLLSDWTDANPEAVFTNLKENSEYYNYHRGTVGTFFSDIRRRGLGQALSNRLMWARMNMTPTDIADVTGATYTYLLNGNPPDANWTAIFQPGERVRLRFINGSSMTFFDVRIPGLRMTVVQADGNDIEPVVVDEFRMGVAETYDVIVEPTPAAAYTIFAQAMDRSGFARGTLALRHGMSAAIPPMDARPIRTMVDMGMAMGGRNMAGTDGMTQTDMAGMPGMPRMPVAAKSAEPLPQPAITVGITPFAQPGPGVRPAVIEPAGGYRDIRLQPSNPVRLHTGPAVDMLPAHISERLNDPGDGLEHNGRRVLTYADLRARYPGADGRPPTREIELHLTGNMQRYIWGFNGEAFAQSPPIKLRLGERVRLVLVNDTMMEHPLHLHGLWSELENGHGAFNPYKQTVIVKPSERVSFLVSADTSGQWAFHCHLLFHMQAGMFRTVVVS